jgi:magnesium chelatase subunit H
MRCLGRLIADPRDRALTRMGDLDMAQPRLGCHGLLKKLRGTKSAPGGKPKSGEKPDVDAAPPAEDPEIHPGKAQDLRAWFLSMQYWLGGSDDNIEAMIRYLVGAMPRPRLAKWSRRRPRSNTPRSGCITPTWPNGSPPTRPPAPPPGPAPPSASDAAQLHPGLGHRRITMPSSARWRRAACAWCPAFAGGLDGRPAMSATSCRAASMRWCR